MAVDDFLLYALFTFSWVNPISFFVFSRIALTAFGIAR
jgi:hypothetical protein